MKRFAFSLALLFLFVVGCSSGSELEPPKQTNSTQPRPTNESTDFSKTYDWEKYYIVPAYDIYSTPASENGLGDTLVYIMCSVTAVETDENGITFYRVNDNGNTWLLSSTAKMSELPMEIGKTVIVYGAYQGVSGRFDDLPVILVTRIKTAGGTWEAMQEGFSMAYALEFDSMSIDSMSSLDDWITETYEGITFKVDPLWEKKPRDNGGHWYYPPVGLVQSDSGKISADNLTDEDARSVFDSLITGLMEDGNAEEISRTNYKIGDKQALKVSIYRDISDERYRMDVVAVLFNDAITNISVAFPISKYKTYKEISEIVLESVDLAIEDTVSPPPFESIFQRPSLAPTSSPSTSPTAQPSPSANSETVSQKNAVSKAKAYLSFMAFSRDGLVAQLEYEQFSGADAIYGADNCGADWNDQAIIKAKSYLDFSAYSHKGLTDQLEYEKFTSEQAEHGADNCGADWNEQAAKKAKSYLDFSSFSRDGLIDQLLYEGFTREQAEYGVDAVGL